MVKISCYPREPIRHANSHTYPRPPESESQRMRPWKVTEGPLKLKA